MKYIGSGKLKNLIELSTIGVDGVVWGRRLKNLRISNLKLLHRRRVVYLDTIDVGSLDKTLLKMRFLVSFYKIEKMLMFLILKALCPNFYHLNIPIIAESEAWKRLDKKGGQKIAGLTYKGVSQLIDYAISKNIKKLKAKSINKMVIDGSVDVCEISVAPSFSLQIINDLKL